LAFATVAAAQTFSANLTVGSKGADVVALQTVLVNAGNLTMPAGVSMGYFGSRTKAAVQAYQASKGVPSTGFVGPLTRAALNAGGPSAYVPPASSGCPVGYTCTPVGGTTLPANGTTVVTPTSLGKADGSISVTTSSVVSTGASIKKGETKNVVAVKLQATAGPVSVTRVDAHLSVRPWLFFSTLQLKDSNGTVLATKSVASPSDSTEITVGSDYLVRFDGLNFVVTPGTNPDLTVSVSVLAATDKITNGMTVYAGIPSGAIRTINGLGFTDSVGGANAFTGTSVPLGAGQTSFTLSSTGSVADISTKISSNSPAAQVSKTVSATIATSDVTLGIFSLKSANNSATVNSLNIQTNTSKNATLQTDIFSNVRLVVGSNSYGATTYTAAGLATFSNLTLNLAQDLWTDIKIIADVAATSTAVTASSTLNASTINAIDSTYTAATVGGVAMASATNNQTSINTLMTVNSVSINFATLPCSTVGLNEKASVNQATAASVSCTFTLTNNSSNSLYVTSRVAGASGLLNGTSSNPTGNASSTLTLLSAVTPVAGDDTAASPTYYILPSSGGSRTFTVSGLIQNRGGSAATEGLYITSIQYGTTNTGLGTSITTGLTTLGTDIYLLNKN